MNIDFSEPGSVKFDMIPYISKILKGFPEIITGVSSTSAADHLFDVRPPQEGLLNLWLTSKSMNRLITNYEVVYSSNG
jgi:hypothetical protein